MVIYRIRIPIILLMVLLAGACGSEEESSATEDPPPSTTAAPTTAAPTTTTEVSPGDVVSVTPDDIPDEPAPDDSAPPPEGERRLAMVNDVQFIIMESFPMQVQVEVSGELPSPCHEVWSEVTADGAVYDVSVWRILPPDTVCAAVIEPFTEIVHLGEGFEFGDYTIVVNGESHTLSL